MNFCANCKVRLGRCTGESGIYNPGEPAFELCEPCFLDEDEAIDERGGNEWPERLELYRRNTGR